MIWRVSSKPAEADAVDAGIVGDEGQVLRARIPNRLDQRLGNAAKAKAARHDGHAILDEACHRRWRILVDLIHTTSLPDRSCWRGRTNPQTRLSAIRHTLQLGLNLDNPFLCIYEISCGTGRLTAAAF